MNIKEIEKLTGMYFEGETSLAEEKLLREFFAGDDVPPHLIQYQPLFRFFADEAAETLSEEKQLETLNRKMDQYRDEVSVIPVHPGKRRLYYFSGIAAGLLILLSLVFVIRNEIGRRNNTLQPGVSPEMAYSQTKQALLLVSVGLNTGIESVQRFKTLDDAVGQVHLMNKLYNYQNQFINPERMQLPSTNK